MEQPNSELWKLFCEAGTESRVPATLLAAIAYQESRYKADAIGPTTKAGWQARGVMQLSPAVLGKYNVTDPFDARANIRAAARWVRNLTLAGDHNTDSVIAAYFWGLSNVNRYASAKKAWPAQVTAYVDAVKGNRAALQAESPAVGANVDQRLGNAIKGLAALNPLVPELVALKDSWETYIANAKPLTADAEVLKDAYREQFWNQYATRYAQAPITAIGADQTSATPTPDKIERSQWMALLSRIARPPEQVPLAFDTPTKPPILQARIVDVDGESESVGPGALTLLLVFAVWFVLQMGPKR